MWLGLNCKTHHDTPRFLFRIRMCLRQKAKRESRKMIKSGMEFELATVAVLYILLYLINTSVLVLIYFKRIYFLIEIQLVILLNSLIIMPWILRQKYYYFLRKLNVTDINIHMAIISILSNKIWFGHFDRNLANHSR